ncbi:MAG TPA: DUF2723 domain-containing protein [Bacteroidota bacterium]|nr:DUF2723 domain-containing protein [Bacteroidota bacterium]
MDHIKLNRIIAGVVFAAALCTYVYTLPPTVVFWDVPEHCAAAFSLQVQHPPGSPLLVLVMHLAAMIPLFSDIAVRMHFANAAASAVVVMLLYLITVRLILLRHDLPRRHFDRIAIYGSAAIGALALTFSTTFWFNALETETRNVSLLFTALIVWLALLWHEKYEEPHSDRYLLLIAFLTGLAGGVHIHGMLGFFVAIVVVYFRYYQGTLRKFFFSVDVLKFGVIVSLVFFAVYPGIVKWYPTMLDGQLFGSESEIWTWAAIALPLVALYLVYYAVKKNKRILHLGAMSFLLVLLGFSVYTVVIIRANADPPMNENTPTTIHRLVAYLNRDQYGATPLLERRWINEPDKVQYFKEYSSDADYFWRYQINHMYLRYFGWNFIGKAGDNQGAGVNFGQLFAIPFLIGLIGLWYHWKIDKKMALTMTIFFILTGFVLAVYFNMQREQPRERDYFFVYSFFAFCMWIGMGTLAIITYLEKKMSEQRAKITAYGMLAAIVVCVPVNMLRTNLHPMSRHGHYMAWDYAYNLLQSTEPNAILITNGDNDTFPLWYLQDVEGIRRDVRIVNLSLLNMDSYILKLKNTEPYGAKKVSMSLSDAEITALQPMEFKPQQMELPVPRSAVEALDRPEAEGSRGMEIVDTVKWIMPATMQFGSVSAIRIQDIVVYDIIRSSMWQRPIYFATTGGDDSKIGLTEYMEYTGLASKLVPRRAKTFWAGVNEGVMEKNLMTETVTSSKTAAYGFFFRGLNDPTVHFDENQRRMMENYRQAFLTLAFYELNEKHAPAEAIRVLDRMEKVMPRRVISIDTRSKMDIMRLYLAAGDTAQAREYASEIVNELQWAVKGAVDEPLSQYHPLLLLTESYQAQGKTDSALAMLDRIGTQYASTPGVTQYVQARRAELLAKKK